MAAKPRANPRFLQLLNQAHSEWGRGSQTKIAKILKVSNQTVTNWKEGIHSPSDLEMDELSRALGNEKYPARSESIAIADNGNGFEKSRIRNAVDEIIQTVTAPIIAFAQGGEGAYPEDQGADVPRIAVPCKDPNCYVLELKGNSMEPVYLEGDLLVVAPNMEPMNNDLVIVRTTDDEVLFKKFKHPKRGEEFQFLSYNPHHPALTLRPDQIFRVSVVHSVIRPLKEKVRAMTVTTRGAVT